METYARPTVCSPKGSCCGSKRYRKIGLSNSLLLLGTALSSALGQDVAPERPSYCVQSPPDINTPGLPRSFGFVLFDGYQSLDVFGPFDALAFLAWQYNIDIHIISETLAPLSNRYTRPATSVTNSTFYNHVLPTTTFATVPELDVLVVPGGMGTRSPTINSTVDFIRAMAPQVDYIVSVCTGARLLAQAGVLDGKRATTNKASWEYATAPATSDKVEWVPQARWVADGNIWTTSGVSAGIDGMLAFIECLYGAASATKVTNFLEYLRTDDSSNDPFAAIFNVTGA